MERDNGSERRKLIGRFAAETIAVLGLMGDRKLGSFEADPVVARGDDPDKLSGLYIRGGVKKLAISKLTSMDDKLRNRSTNGRN